MKRVRQLWVILTRRKPAFGPDLQDRDGDRVRMRRDVLTLTDLTLLGVGATLGTGVYILAGQTAYDVAGPAVILSFLIAAIASLLAGLCYAELASALPSAGTAYTYSYVSIGEFPAFFVGWNLVLEYAIATASVARAFSSYVDVVSGNAIRSWSLRSIPMKASSFLAEYPGILALAFITLLAVLLSVGAKESSLFNNVCTLFNLATLAITIVAGAIVSDPANWSVPRQDIPPTVPPRVAGEGGFLPFGMVGVLAGAAKCFFGYVGFDTVTACGEEAKNPKRNIPLAIFLALSIIFLTYLSVAVVATMMVPYYEQDVDAPFPSAFKKVGLPTISWVVTIGAMFAMCTSMVGSMFPLPRVLLTMASDGMLFRSLAHVSAATGTSPRCTLLAWLLSGSMALLFNLDQLVDMMSIGTLTAYIVVAVSVVQLRYGGGVEAEAAADATELAVPLPPTSVPRVLRAILNCGRTRQLQPSAATAWVVTGAQLLFLVLSVPASYLLASLPELSTSNAKAAALAAIMILILFDMLCISLQPRSTQQAFGFKIPFVPLVPYISILVNMSLMMMMNWATWTRFGTWLLGGVVLYFLYSIDHSSLAQTVQQSQSKPASRTTLPQTEDVLSALPEGPDPSFGGTQQLTTRGQNK